MAFTEGVFRKAIQQMMTGALDLSNDDIRVLLVDSSHNSDLDDDTIGDFTLLSEVAGTGYSTGGVALTGEVVTHDSVNDRVEFDAVDATYSSVDGFTTAGGILYKFVTNVGLSLPIAVITSGGFPKTANGGDLVFTWNAEGILQGS